MVVLDPGMARTRKMEMMPARYAFAYVTKECPVPAILKLGDARAQ